MIAKPERNMMRWRQVGDKFVVTNDAGEFVVLTPAEMDLVASNKVKPGSELETRLLARHMLMCGEDCIEEAAEAFGRKASYLYRGPVLHIMVVTLRCNQVCKYCHASRAGMKETENDMSITTAEKVVDMAMRSPSDSITIEFQGGEPLVNWEVVKHVVEYGTMKADAAGKRVMFSLVSNLSMMDDEKLDYLVRRRVQISTSLDGPKDIHDGNRKLSGASAHDKCVFWMDRINKAYVAAGLDPKLYHVEALATITREHLNRARDLVDEYIARGCRAIFMRPLNPFGYAKQTEQSISYSADDFLKFYDEALKYIIEQNRRGVEVMERLAAIFLTKIMTPDDPNYLDIRNPCGAGVGQIAYNHDGSIFTCDEGRMVYQMGDDIFKLGEIDNMTLKDVVTHETVKTLMMASTLDSIPGCATCAYKPWCGTCPVYNYGEQGNIFPQNSTNQRCRIYMGVQDRLMKYFVDNDTEVIDIFRRWVEVKERPEYLHDGRPKSDDGSRGV